MQIRNLSAGHPDPAGLAKPGETGEIAAGQRAKAGQLPALPASGEATAMAEILSRFDVTEISPAEFSRMIQKLFEAGTISQKELQELAAIRLDLDADGVDADESIDLLDFYARKITKAQRHLSDADAPEAASQQLAPLLHRLDWLEKFALIQSAPETMGLDTLA